MRTPVDAAIVKSDPLVGAIILNWNRSDDTIRAIGSLRRTTGARLFIIVVDNGSKGEDVHRIRTAFPDVTIVENHVNHGFARGVNIGAAIAISAGAEHILLLNNDAFFSTESPALEACVDALESDLTIGAVGPVIVDDDYARTIQSAGLFFSMWFPVPIGNARGRTFEQAARFRKPSYLMGSCLLIRAETFASIGGLDPQYFFFGEDIDLSFRLRRCGQHERLLTNVFIVHRKSSSVREGSSRYAYTALRANLLLVKRNAAWYHLPTAIATLLGISIALCIRSATSWRSAGPAPVLRAWKHFFQNRLGGLDGYWALGYTPIDFERLWRESAASRDVKAVV